MIGGLLWDGTREALHLLATADPEVLEAGWRSLWISTLAVVVASAFGLPAGLLLGQCAFPGRRAAVLVLRAAMGIPTVFVGVLCYGLLSRRGPLGFLDLLFTPWAIVAGEVLLAFPIVASMTYSAVVSLDPRVAETAWTLGAGWLQRAWTMIGEARTAIMVALIAAFGRCVTELGVALMVGGNIAHRTRTLATYTALETSKGEFARAMAAGLILLAIALAVTVLLAGLGRENAR